MITQRYQLDTASPSQLQKWAVTLCGFLAETKVMHL